LQAIAWAGLAAASYLCNLGAARTVGSPRGWCSSIVLTLRRADVAEDRARSPVQRHEAGLMALCAIS
jgi:hypothetical protein